MGRIFQNCIITHANHSRAGPATLQASVLATPGPTQGGTGIQRPRTMVLPSTKKKLGPPMRVVEQVCDRALFCCGRLVGVRASCPADCGGFHRREQIPRHVFSHALQASDEPQEEAEMGQQPDRAPQTYATPSHTHDEFVSQPRKRKSDEPYQVRGQRRGEGGGGTSLSTAEVHLLNGESICLKLLSAFPADEPPS